MMLYILSAVNLNDASMPPIQAVFSCARIGVID